MTPELKEKLLLKKFSSIEYMEEFSKHFFSFIEAGFSAVDAYKQNPPNPDIAGNKIQDFEGDLKLWELKVLPNFKRMYKHMETSISKARQGSYDSIESAAGNLRGLGKDMDGIRESFMDAVNPNIKNSYFDQLKLARRKGNNIYYTLDDWWEPGEILNEKITGPIDEQDLLRYLKPGDRENS